MCCVRRRKEKKTKMLFLIVRKGWERNTKMKIGSSHKLADSQYFRFDFSILIFRFEFLDFLFVRFCDFSISIVDFFIFDFSIF
jgi:hypothetical protein